MNLIDIDNLEEKIIKLVEESRETVFFVEHSNKYSVRKEWNLSDKEISEKINAALGSIITMGINEMILEHLVINYGSKELLESYNDLQSRAGKIVKAHFNELAGAPKKKAKDPAQEAKLILKYLNDARKGINPRLRAFPDDPGILKYIRARMREGKTYQDFVTVIDFKCKQWKGVRGRGGKNMETFLRPKTLFSADHFADYLVEAQSASDQQEEPVKNETEGWME